MKWTKVVIHGADAGMTIEQAMHALTATPAGARQLVPGFEIRLHIEKGNLPKDDVYEFFASPEARFFLSGAANARGEECDKPSAPNGLAVGETWTTVMART